MAPQAGLKPTTFRFEDERSIQLSYKGMEILYQIGTLGRIRTYNLLIRSQELYPV